MAGKKGIRRVSWAVVALLAVGIGIALVVLNDPQSGMRTRSARVALGDRSKIDRIALRGPSDSTLLIRLEDRWYISGLERASSVAIENLLFAAERLQVTSLHTLPGDTGRQQYTRVEFFSGKRLVLGYRFFPRGDKALIVVTGSLRAFMVSLPGYGDSDLGEVFSSSAAHYREHVLIDLQPSDISQVEVTRRGGPTFRFSMDDRGELNCILPGSDSILPREAIDDLSVRLLLSYFATVRYEEPAGELRSGRVREEQQDRWLASLKVVSRQGVQHTLEVYSLPGERGTGDHLFRALVLHNDDTIPLVINYIYLDVLMRDPAHYFSGGGWQP